MQGVSAAVIAFGFWVTADSGRTGFFFVVGSVFPEEFEILIVHKLLVETCCVACFAKTNALLEHFCAKFDFRFVKKV